VNAILDKFKGFLIRLREWILGLIGRSPVPIQSVETITVFVGTVEGPKDGRRRVLFEGRKLADRAYSQGNERICETLYESRGRLLVHTQTLYRVEGLRTVYELRELSERELSTEFPKLSRLRSSLRLEEALSQ
jgi:hypothetical protein